jgi:hypothetical protein
MTQVKAGEPQMKETAHMSLLGLSLVAPDGLWLL